MTEQTPENPDTENEGGVQAQAAGDFESAPQVESETTVKAPANGGDRNRLPSEASQPAALVRPLEESARLANERDEDTILGQGYTVTRDKGYRRS